MTKTFFHAHSNAQNYHTQKYKPIHQKNYEISRWPFR